MKKSSLILAVIFLFSVCSSFQIVNAQEKSKEEKEKELQELIIEQKKHERPAENQEEPKRSFRNRK